MSTVKSIIARKAKKQENGTHDQEKNNKNFPLGGLDIGFSSVFKAAIFSSVQRTEQKYSLDGLTHRESHKINTIIKRERNANSIKSQTTEI